MEPDIFPSNGHLPYSMSRTSSNVCCCFVFPISGTKKKSIFIASKVENLTRWRNPKISTSVLWACLGIGLQRGETVLYPSGKGKKHEGKKLDLDCVSCYLDTNGYLLGWLVSRTVVVLLAHNTIIKCCLPYTGNDAIDEENRTQEGIGGWGKIRHRCIMHMWSICGCMKAALWT